jgi:23S rRNA pseudouridine1911/1915/1917 synthase
MPESDLKIINVPEEIQGIRLDKYLPEIFPDFSRGVWQKVISHGGVIINGKPAASNKVKLSGGDILEIKMPSAESVIPLPEPENIELDILFEDKDILVINKRPGIIVHPGDGNPAGTIVNALLFRYNDSLNFGEIFEDKYRPGIVHRLDKDTSGALIIAKNENILQTLKASFKNREVKKTYYAIVQGVPKKHFDTIRFAIDRHPVNRKKMAVSPNGKEAVTHFTFVQGGYIDNQPVSILEVKIETGRTHQIRVHLSEIGIPVIGDKIYGGVRKKPKAPRQMLHACNIVFPHPVTGKKISITAPIPDDMQDMIDKMHS